MENLCRVSTDPITPPSIGAVVVKELPETGVANLIYVVDSDPVGIYEWDGTQFVSVGGGGSEYRDAYIALAERHALSETLVLPEGPSQIGYNAIAFFDDGDPAVTEIVVPEGVVEIRGGAFSGCVFLESIDLPSTVTSIFAMCFEDCDELRSITIRATNPPSLAASSFNGVPSNAIFYVPAASVDAYKAARDWSNRAAYIQAIQ